MTPTRLTELRQGVTEINLEILRMLNRRGNLTLEISEIKQHLEMPLHDTSREQTQLDELSAANNGPFPDESIYDIFRKIFEHSRKLMKTGRTKV